MPGTGYRVPILVAACLLTMGCRDQAPSLDHQAEAYVRLVLALGDRDPDSLDFYAGPPDWQAEARAKRATLQDVRRQALVLQEQLGDDERSAFLRAQLRAVTARVDLLNGRRFTANEEMTLLFGVTPDARPRGTDDARAELDRLLPGPASLARRYAEFDRRFVVAPEGVAAVIARAIDECRRITRDHLVLPPREHVTVSYAHGMPWSAFTRYAGHGVSRIDINADFALTVDRALSLACHEAYPGHHTINLLIESAHPHPEFTIQPLFSPQTFRTEGAATFAPELAFSDDDRMIFERDQLFPLAGLNPADAELYAKVSRLVDRLRPEEADIARAYLDGALEFARAAAALEDRALMASPDATLKFFNQFRSYAFAYTLGRDAAAKHVGNNRGDERWRAYERWVTELR